MKTRILKLALLALLPALWFGCKDSQEFEAGSPAPVTEFLSPGNNSVLPLVEASSAVMEFSWKGIANGQVPVYSVVFYASQTGAEIYRVQSDKSGLNTMAYIPHSTMNTVAALAGVSSQQQGELWWSVATAVGTSEVLANHPRWKVSVKRLRGVTAPASLYLTGSATEAGTDMTAALPLRRNSNGTFEIYTQLKGGTTDTYLLIDNPTDGAAKTLYGLDNGALTQGDFPIALRSGEANTGNGAYRITVDFAKGTLKKELLTDLKYHFPSNDPQTQTMTYIGGGVWKITAKNMNFTPSWGGSDNRYKFRVTVDGVEKTWGRDLDNRDNGTVPTTLDGEYFRIYETARTSDNWDYSYRAIGALNGITTDIYVDMSVAAEYYHHRFDPGNITPYPVASLDVPAANAAVTLSKVAGSATTFSWTPAAASGTGPTPSYKVVFYRDAQGATEIARKDAASGGTATNASVTHSDLETIAATAGIASEGTGNIYWSVITNVFGAEAKPAFAPRALSITRLPGMPAAVYITGSASEYGATIGSAGQLKSLGGGKFEIYTKLATGTYYFTDKNTAGGRMFVVSGTAISESSTPTSYTTKADDGENDKNVYRITLDFSSNTAKYEEINRVLYHFAPRTTDNRKVPYLGKGVWKMTNYPVNFNNGDQRYRFSTRVDGQNGRNNFGSEIWGTLSQGGYEDRAPNTATVEEGYFYIYITAYTGDWWWDYKYKFHSTLNGKTIDISVIMSPDGTYRHLIENIR